MTTGGFTVDVHALAGLPRLLDRLGADSRAAAAHCDTHTTVHRAGEGLINLLGDGHEHVRRETAGFFRAGPGSTSSVVSTWTRWRPAWTPPVSHRLRAGRSTGRDRAALMAVGRLVGVRA